MATTLAIGSKEQSERAFLISEAVRGEGGILRNQRGEAFMQGKHPRADLAPRDIVTRAILSEMRKEQIDNVWLDVSSMDEEFFKHRFPTIYQKCHDEGIDVPREYIPIRPSQHYQMGGIQTDLYGKTSVEGLYAAGECAWTGIHGANRLASNSMLECLVFGRRAAEYINGHFRSSEGGVVAGRDESKDKCTDVEDKQLEVRKIVSEYANAVRTRKGLIKGKKLIDEISEKADKIKLVNPKDYDYYNMVCTAKMILDGANERKESIGAHYIED